MRGSSNGWAGSSAESDDGCSAEFEAGCSVDDVDDIVGSPLGVCLSLAMSLDLQCVCAL